MQFPSSKSLSLNIISCLDQGGYNQSYIWEADRQKIIDLHGGRINDHSFRKYFTLLFLRGTLLSPAQTYEGLFSCHSPRPLDTPLALHLELQRINDPVGCAGEVPEGQGQLS